MTGIYGIRFKPTGRVYVGQSLDIDSRISAHQTDLKNDRHHNDILQHYYNKYGLEQFEFVVLEICSEESLTEREQFWIDDYGGFESDGTFNLMPASPSGPRGEHTRRKISESRKGMTFSEETRRKIGEASRGRPCTPETREKLRQANIGKTHTQEARDKICKAVRSRPGTNTGKHFTEEHRKRISESTKGRVSPNRGKEMSDEQKEKIRMSVRKSWEQRRKKVRI